MIEKGESKHFVLVHGFCHGGWCWYKLAAALKSNGCRATALDLAGLAPSFSDYVRPLMDLLASLPDGERVVLVGHSYAGLAISSAMENFPSKFGIGKDVDKAEFVLFERNEQEWTVVRGEIWCSKTLLCDM